MNQQRYGRSPVPRRAGLAQPTRSQVYSDMVDADDYEDEYDDQWPPPAPRSAIRYTEPSAPVIISGNRKYVLHSRLPQPPQQSIPQPQMQPRPRPQLRPQVQAQPEYDDEVDEIPVRPRRRPRLRVHPMVILGFGMILMLTLWILGSMFLNWWQVTQDDWHFGRPRTFQIDAVVNHNHDSPANPSHFIVVNYRSHINIFELPAGDSSKTKVYILPLYGQGGDLATATVAFKDINGDNKPDMIIIVNQATHIAYINDNEQFRPLKPGEQTALY